MNNPSLREEPREQRAAVISSHRDSSILDWLEKSGRLMAREVDENGLRDNYRDDEEELSDLMAGSDGYPDDDTDDAGADDD